MTIAPDQQSFCASYQQGKPQLVWQTLVGDLETPVSAFLKLSRSRSKKEILLLESVEGNAARGRYSMIGLDPDIVWKVENDKAWILHCKQASGEFTQCGEKPLDSLRKLIAESAIEATAAKMPPMAAGIFGYLGYDLVRQMERLAPAKPDVIGVPDAMFMRPTIMVVFDGVKDEISLVTPVRPQADVNAASAYARALDRLDMVVRELEGPAQSEDRVDPHLLAQPPQSNTPPERFLSMVEQAKEHILAGDIFQVVLSQRFSAPFGLPPFSLYRALRRINPAPFLCYLDFGDFQIVCSSPEILVRVREGKVTIRPIAGTRVRGMDEAQDMALEQELLTDEKERAEHLMLLDLGRNDVGRVAEIGSVAVTGKFFVERYSHVMHIVSNVEGRLAKGYDVIDALCGGFPAGTVSGAPKVRAMQIIDELEVDKRGIYGGCIGYFGATGEMDTCIVLRTSIVKDLQMHVQAGAGIVADSMPQLEQQECINKSMALFTAAQEAVSFATRSGKGQ